MPDLFSTSHALEQIPIVDGDIQFQKSVNLGQSNSSLLHTFISGVPWRQESVQIWGKQHAQPRLIAWYGDPGRCYSYSGISLAPLPWTEMLWDLKQRIERATGATFNSVLLNYYRDGRDSMGFHSDDEAELGRRPTIASISLGETRTFILKHKTNRAIRPIRLLLSSGSLLVMRGSTQEFWKHGIEKEPNVQGARINLTFRHIVEARGALKAGKQPSHAARAS